MYRAAVDDAGGISTRRRNLRNTDDLAARANEHRRLYLEGVKDVADAQRVRAEHAKACGEALLEAKKAVKAAKQQKWSEWLAEYFEDSESMAYEYTLIVKRWSDITKLMKKHPEWSVFQALDATRKPQQNPKRRPKDKQAERDLLSRIQKVLSGLSPDARELLPNCGDAVIEELFKPILYIAEESAKIKRRLAAQNLHGPKHYNRAMRNFAETSLALTPLQKQVIDNATQGKA